MRYPLPYFGKASIQRKQNKQKHRKSLKMKTILRGRARDVKSNYGFARASATGQQWGIANPQITSIFVR